MKQQLEKEYLEFIEVGEVPTSRELDNKILKHVQQLMNPSLAKVSFKLLKIFIFFSVFTLSICPQFGVGFIKDSHLFDFFMSFGHLWCKFLCGVFFLGSSMCAAVFLLTTEEFAVLRRYLVIKLSALIIISLLVLWLLGASFSTNTVTLWMFGSYAGGLSAVFAGYLFNRPTAHA